MQLRRRAARLTGRLSLSLISLCLMLVILEFVVRAEFPQQNIRTYPELFVPVNGWGWRHAPNVDLMVNTGERTVRFVTNDDGHRISALAQPATEADFKILVLGDSFAAAMQVEYEDTMVARLDTLLTQQWGQSVHSLDTAVSSWSPYQYYFEADMLLAREDFDLVIVYLYLPNDIVFIDHPIALPPRAREFSYKLRWPRSLTWNEILNALVRPIDKPLRENSQLYMLARNASRPLWYRLGLEVPTFSSGVFKSNADAYWWGSTASVCAYINARGAEVETPTLFVMLPGWLQVDEDAYRRYRAVFGIDADEIDLDQPSRRLRQEMEARGLTVIDATPALRAAWQAGARDLYGSVDYHFDPEGHRITAEFVAEWLIANGVPPVRPVQELTSAPE